MVKEIMMTSDRDLIDDTDSDEDYINEPQSGWDNEEMAVDYHLQPDYEDAPVAPSPEPAGRPARKSGRKYKIRRMPKTMLTKFPDVESIFITKINGKQILFIRK
jgi:hypothetical protein